MDSDWAGDVLRRRSTTGFVAMLGSHCIKHNSLMQTAIGLSSAEAEFYACCRGAATGLGILSYCGDLGCVPELVLHSDSSAARAVASRRELGKLRRVHTRYLWLQQQVATKNAPSAVCAWNREPSGRVNEVPHRNRTREALSSDGLGIRVVPPWGREQVRHQ